MNNAKMVIETASVEETFALGGKLGQALRPGTAIALVGTLGAGKTHLVKGVARGAGVPTDVIVNSPTFVLVNEYAGRLPIFHLDAYRMSGADELDALGFDEMLTGDGAVLVEWADRVRACLPEDHLQIQIDVTGETARKFTLTASGPASSALLGRIA